MFTFILRVSTLADCHDTQPLGRNEIQEDCLAKSVISFRVFSLHKERTDTEGTLSIKDMHGQKFFSGYLLKIQNLIIGTRPKQHLPNIRNPFRPMQK